MPFFLLVFCLIGTIAESAPPVIEAPQEGRPLDRSPSKASPPVQAPSKQYTRFKIISLFGLAAALGFGAYKFLNSASPTPNPPSPSHAPTLTIAIIPDAIAQKLLNELQKSQYGPSKYGNFTSETLTSVLDEVFKEHPIKNDEGLPILLTLSDVATNILRAMHDLACLNSCNPQSSEQMNQKICDPYGYLFRILCHYETRESETIIQKCSELMRIYQYAQKDSSLKALQPPRLSRTTLRASIIKSDILPLLNHPYALNATIIRFIVDCAISQEEMTALSQITLSTDSPYTSTLPIHQETSEIPNVFLQNLSAWLYIAGLPKDDPLKSAMLYKNKTPGSSIIDTMAQSMDATPDFQSIAYFCSTISAFTSCQASFLGFLKALNLEYPDKFNRCFK